MNIKNILKNNAKLYIIMGIIILLGTIGITLAIVINDFNPIAVNTTTGTIDAEITYNDGSNSSIITSEGTMLPIADSIIEENGINIDNSKVIKAEFNVTGLDSNPNNTIYDIALYSDNIPCEFRNEEVKWRLYRNDEMINSGNLSPTFDTMSGGRLVLTSTQESLSSTVTNTYTFIMWISEACTGNITECDANLDQSKYLNKSFTASLKIELSTKSKKVNERTTSSELSCEYTETEVPACNNLTYNGSNQTLISTNDTYYTIKNNVGTNAGYYSATLKLNDGYKWSDGTIEDRAVTCEIDKATIYIETIGQTITYSETISTSVDNAFVTSDYNLIEGHTLSNITLTPSRVDVGAGVIEASNAKIVDSEGNDVTSNYNITYDNAGVLTINCANVSTMPSNISASKYTGESQIGVSGGEYVDISGVTTATEVGEYIAYVTPKKNYCWSDSTIDTKTITWTIEDDVSVINLDNIISNNEGTNKIYYRAGKYYLDSTYSKEMTETENNIEVPRRIGYAFGGYYTEENGSGTQIITNDGYATSSLLSAAYEEDITLYANWIATTYTIKYHANGGSGAPESQTKMHGETLTLSSTEPTREGYTFLGWSTNMLTTIVTYEPSTTFSENSNTTLYAVWKANTYTINYDANGGTGTMDSSTHTYDVAKTLSPNTYTRTGYTFEGWAISIENSAEFSDEEEIINLTSTNEETVTLYAIWEANTYTVMFMENEDESLESRTVTYGSTYSDLPTPTKTGYSLEGWYTEPDGAGTKITSTTSVLAMNITCYANWIDDIEPEITSVTSSSEYDQTNSVTFSANDDGSGIAYYNITNDISEPENWIPIVESVEEDIETKYEYEASWARVFHHNSHYGEKLYTDSSEALSSSTTDKYSVLSNLENYRNSSGKFEFLLEYPELDGYNRWIQTANPATTTVEDSSATQVEGYSALNISFPSWAWGGLALSSHTEALIDGDPGVINWWTSIGQYRIYDGGLTGPYPNIVGSVNLWVRIDDKENVVNTSLTRTIGDIDNNGTYYVWVKDSNGNVSYKDITIGKVDTQPPTITNYAGEILYSDTIFASGNNSISTYGGTTITRKEITDIPNSSGYGLEIKSVQTNTYGAYGGFTWATSCAAGSTKEYLVKFIAKIPSGYYIQFNSNGWPSGIAWLTNPYAAGDWYEYVFYLPCESPTSAFTTNYFSIDSNGGSAPTTDSPITWYVSYATVIDISSTTKNYGISLAKDAGSGISGYQLTSDSKYPSSWTSVSNLQYSSMSFSSSILGGGTYYAHFKDSAGNINSSSITVENPTYTVSYNANGGSGTPSSQTKEHNVTLTLSSTTPTRTGYSFLGWSTSSTATSATYSAGGSYTSNSSTTLYAVWKPNTYTVKFNANGGTGAPASQTKTHGVALTLSSTKPTKTGYTFLGWSTNSSATSATYSAGGSYTSNSSTTLYAVWKIAGTVVNNYKYTLENINSNYRLTKYYVTNCDAGTCYYNTINGLDNSFTFATSFPSVKTGYAVFIDDRIPNWSVSESNLIDLDTSNSSNTIMKQTVLRYSKIGGITCYSEASEDGGTDTKVVAWTACVSIRVIRTTSTYDDSNDWWYSTTYSCYLRGDKLTTSNPC